MRILKEGTKIGKLESIKRERKENKKRCEASKNIPGEMYRNNKHFY